MYLQILAVATVLVRPILDGDATVTRTRLIANRLVASRLVVSRLAGFRLIVPQLASRRLGGARALVEYKGRDLAMIDLIRIHRVGNDSIRGTLGKEIIAVLHPLSVEGLLIRNKGMSVAILKK